MCAAAGHTLQPLLGWAMCEKFSEQSIDMGLFAVPETSNGCTAGQRQEKCCKDTGEHTERRRRMTGGKSLMSACQLHIQR